MTRKTKMQPPLWRSQFKLSLHETCQLLVIAQQETDSDESFVVTRYALRLLTDNPTTPQQWAMEAAYAVLREEQTNGATSRALFEAHKAAHALDALRDASYDMPDCVVDALDLTDMMDAVESRCVDLIEALREQVRVINIGLSQG